MINIRSIKKLGNEDGLTLKNGVKVVYKSGWQVATHGEECTTPRECMNLVKKYKGCCGIWFSDGIYYVDYSFRVNTKKEALKIGREHGQISILGWKGMRLVYC